LMIRSSDSGSSLRSKTLTVTSGMASSWVREAQP
jgi:hypothetical protein